jgi:hypothetical protein
MDICAKYQLQDFIWANPLSFDDAYSPTDVNSLVRTEPNSPPQKSRTSTPPVLIIAPSLSHELYAPICLQEAASRRLKVLLSKERQQRTEDGLSPPASLNYNSRLAVDLDFRKEVIDWILCVSSLNRFYRYLYAISQLKPYKPATFDDLYNQLCISAETRFMAAYLFSRFFYISGIEEEPEFLAGGYRDYIWDVAVACIALSVKVCSTR